jgi:hypothetical protein
LRDQISVLRDRDVLHVVLKDENWSQTSDFDTVTVLAWRKYATILMKLPIIFNTFNLKIRR